MLSEITSQINSLPQNPHLKICLGGTQGKTVTLGKLLILSPSSLHQERKIHNSTYLLLGEFLRQCSMFVRHCAVGCVVRPQEDSAIVGGVTTGS